MTEPRVSLTCDIAWCVALAAPDGKYCRVHVRRRRSSTTGMRSAGCCMTTIAS